MLRHIPVTINEQLPGKERESARNKIAAIRERFAEQALKHSECPTAMNGGALGSLPRSQLWWAESGR